MSAREQQVSFTSTGHEQHFLCSIYMCKQLHQRDTALCHAPHLDPKGVMAGEGKMGKH